MHNRRDEMTIKWTEDYPKSMYSSMTGIDEAGNIYRTPANRETVTITTPDGRKAIGWTAEDALKSVNNN